jgi:hypothetical protein
MSDSRRTFLRVSLSAALFAVLPLKNSFGQSFKERDGNPGDTPPAQVDPLNNYSKASFVSYLNSIFQIQTAAGVVAVMLAKVDDMPAPRGGECFSLLFRGDRMALKQNTYVIVHPALGTFQLLVVPAGSDQNGASEYLVTINRLSLADFSRVTAPTRIAVTGQSNRSSSNSSAGNPTTNSSYTSTGNTSKPVAVLTVTQPTLGQPATIVAPNSSAPVCPRKRKPGRKRVDAKSAVIN